MIVEDLRTRELGQDVERSAAIRWRGGEHRVTVQVPAELALPEDDASPFVVASLLSAMRRHEPLHVDGTVSARLLRRIHHAQAIHCAWDPTLAPCDIHVARTNDEPAGDMGVGAFFSRGVDSLFVATDGTRADRPPLTHLIFSPTLQGVFDERVQLLEVARTREAAAALGLSLVVVRTNVRDFLDLTVDWEDAYGAGLGVLALALAGGLGTVVIPSTHYHGNLKAWGSHPLLDPLYSTESVEVLHDPPDQHRAGRVAHIAAVRPDLLPFLKVCNAESRIDNCGRCEKCLGTMAYLECSGALGRATGFPSQLDLGALRATRPTHALRLEYVEAARMLDPATQGPLREALLGAVRDGARIGLRERARAAVQLLRGEREHAHPLWSHDAAAFHRTWINRWLGVTTTGDVYPPLERRADPLTFGGTITVGPLDRTEDGSAAPEDLVGIVRVLDRPAGRHVYGAGAVPSPLRAADPKVADRRQLVGELGSLRGVDAGAGIPVWLSADGRLLTEAMRQPAGRPSPAVAVRWAIAPATWHDSAGPRRRALAAFRRVLQLPEAFAARSSWTRPDGAPVGYLDREPGPGRVALHAAVHPVTGDQLVTSDPFEAIDLGYGEPVMLGYAVAAAPVTGRFGTTRPVLEWASRFGQRVRDSA